MEVEILRYKYLTPNYELESEVKRYKRYFQ